MHILYTHAHVHQYKHKYNMYIYLHSYICILTLLPVLLRGDCTAAHELCSIVGAWAALCLYVAPVCMRGCTGMATSHHLLKSLFVSWHCNTLQRTAIVCVRGSRQGVNHPHTCTNTYTHIHTPMYIDIDTDVCMYMNMWYICIYIYMICKCTCTYVHDTYIYTYTYLYT